MSDFVLGEDLPLVISDYFDDFLPIDNLIDIFDIFKADTEGDLCASLQFFYQLLLIGIGRFSLIYECI